MGDDCTRVGPGSGLKHSALQYNNTSITFGINHGGLCLTSGFCICLIVRLFQLDIQELSESVQVSKFPNYDCDVDATSQNLITTIK